MRRIVYLILSIVIVLSLCACGKQTSTTPSAETSQVTKETQSAVAETVDAPVETMPDTTIDTTTQTEELGTEVDNKEVRNPIIARPYHTNLNDNLYHVTLRKDGDNLIAEAWQQVYYHKNDVEKLDVNDNIIIDDNFVIVNEVEVIDIPEANQKVIAINLNTELIQLCSDGSGEYARFIEGVPVLEKVFEREVTFTEDFKFVDDIDPEVPDEERTFDKDYLIQAFTENPDKFDYMTTTAQFDENWQVAAIYNRYYFEIVETGNPEIETMPKTVIIEPAEDSNETARFLDGPLMPCAKELSLTNNPVKFERIDGNEFLVKVYAIETFKGSELELAGIGSTVVVGGKEYVVDSAYNMKGEISCINLTSGDKGFMFFPTENDNYLASDGEGNYIYTEVYNTRVIIDENVAYGDPAESEKLNKKFLTGEDFINVFEERPESFEMTNTNADFVDWTTLSMILVD